MIFNIFKRCDDLLDYISDTEDEVASLRMELIKFEKKIDNLERQLEKSNARVGRYAEEAHSSILEFKKEITTSVEEFVNRRMKQDGSTLKEVSIK